MLIFHHFSHSWNSALLHLEQTSACTLQQSTWMVKTNKKLLQYGVHFRTSSVIKWKGVMPQKPKGFSHWTKRHRLQVSGKTTSGVRSPTIRHQPKRTQIKRHQLKSHRAKRTQIKRHQTKSHRAKRTQVECDVSRCPAPCDTHAVQNKQSGEQRLRMAEGGKPLLIYFILTVIIKCYTN